MAATKSQGRAFGIFMLGATVSAIGLTYFSAGSGKLAFFVGLVGLAASMGIFLKIKPEEGMVPEAAQPVVLKLAGLVAALGGFMVVLLGLHMTTAVGGRMVASLIGLAVSLVGLLYLLPAAANKNAIWKA
jgi:hypothetical protein